MLVWLLAGLAVALFVAGGEIRSRYGATICATPTCRRPAGPGHDLCTVCEITEQGSTS